MVLKICTFFCISSAFFLHIVRVRGPPPKTYRSKLNTDISVRRVGFFFVFANSDKSFFFVFLFFLVRHMQPTKRRRRSRSSSGERQGEVLTVTATEKPVPKAGPEGEQKRFEAEADEKRLVVHDGKESKKSSGSPVLVQLTKCNNTHLNAEFSDGHSQTFEADKLPRGFLHGLIEDIHHFPPISRDDFESYINGQNTDWHQHFNPDVPPEYPPLNCNDTPPKTFAGAIKTLKNFLKGRNNMKNGDEVVKLVTKYCPGWQYPVITQLLGIGITYTFLPTQMVDLVLRSLRPTSTDSYRLALLAGAAPYDRRFFNNVPADEPEVKSPLEDLLSDLHKATTKVIDDLKSKGKLSTTAEVSYEWLPFFTGVRLSGDFNLPGALASKLDVNKFAVFPDGDDTVYVFFFDSVTADSKYVLRLPFHPQLEVRFGSLTHFHVYRNHNITEN